MEALSITLQAGTEVTIREATTEDAADLLHLKRAYISNTTTIPMYLDEYPVDVAREARVIQQYRDTVNSILLVAEYEEQLIGNIDITGSTRRKMHHTGMIGMGIAEQWRGKGLGTALMEHALAWAKLSTLTVLWLDVYASNTAGIRLYEKTGFLKAGVVKDYFKESWGYVDKIQMYKVLGSSIPSGK